MSTLLLFLALGVGPANSDSDDLFARLDRNMDKRVTSDELRESQQRFFQRALRVADHDEDGALSEEELTIAVSDRKPVSLPGIAQPGMPGRRDGENLRALDRNRDGEITLGEVPAPLKPRFERLLERVGKKSVSVNDVQRYLGTNRDDRSDGDEKMMDAGDESRMEPTVTPGAEKSGKKKSLSPGAKGRKKANRSEK